MTLTDGPPSSGADRPQRAPRDRRTVTVMFADVVGSTATTAERDLEAGYALLNSPVETVVTVVERHGGTVNKLLGDGVMATFGAPVMLEDHAPRACRCALAIQESLAASNSPVKIRIGINSGPALITQVIEGTHRGYDTHGPTVNLVSRIEAEATPGSVFISDRTFRLVRGAFACREVGARSLKGFSEPQLIYELLHEESNSKLRRSAEYRIATPFLGRDQEFAAAGAMLAHLQSGRGALLLVVGEAGIGKSRLLAEIRRGAPDDLEWLEGHCDAFTERVSFWPFIELLRPVVGPSEATEPPENYAELQRNLSDLLGRQAEEILPYIARLLGVEIPSAEQERLSHLQSEVVGAQINRAARRLFEHMAARRPRVLVLEDLHWSDRSSCELLEHLLPILRTLPILFIVLSRPESEHLASLREAASQELAPNQFRELAVAPLTPDESRKLLVAILGDDERLSRLRERILSRIEGNPFFLEETVRELIDLSALIRDEVRGTWAARDLDIPIPQTVEVVLLARIDRLDDRLREILGIAAVIGRTFLYRLLRAVTAADVDEPLARLSASDLIQQFASTPELAYLFRHALTHQAVYDSLLLEKRHQLHARVAAVLEEIYTGRSHEITSLLAFHYARAQVPERALHYLVEAAEQSGRMAADDEALKLLEEAVAVYWNPNRTDPDPERRARIEWQLGAIHFRRGDHQVAEKNLLRAIELSGDPIPNGRFRLIRAVSLELIRHVLNALRKRSNMSKLTTAKIDDANEARLRPYETLGFIYFLSDQRRLLFIILRSANAAAKAGYIEGVIKTTAALGYGLDLIGCSRIASRYHRDALTICERYGDPPGSAFAKNLWGNYLVVHGRWRDAERVLDDARKTADRTGDLLVWSDACGQMCYIWNETAEFDRVIELSESMIARGQEAAFRPALRWGLMERGKALRRTGRLEAAHSVLNQAFEMSVADADFFASASASGDLALTMIVLGHSDEAASMLNEMHRRVIERKIRMYPVCGMYLALAELALLRLERGTTRIIDARRACHEANRKGRPFSTARPAALRLEGRLAALSRQPRRAERLWRRAAAVAEKLGAHYESSLIERERERDRHRMATENDDGLLHK